jgi:hypothetical protein
MVDIYGRYMGCKMGLMGFLWNLMVYNGLYKI